MSGRPRDQEECSGKTRFNNRRKSNDTADVYNTKDWTLQILKSDIRVLCVENHPEYMGALKYMLEKAGYEVTLATTGDQALRLLTTLHVDGVLLEYDLPDATGSALRTEMKRIKPDVPVLLFAGIGSQTLLLLRFLDAYLRNPERPEFVLRESDG